MFSVRSLATVLMLITQAKVSTQSAVTCPDIENETSLDFANATVTESTLQTEGKLQFDNVGYHRKGDIITRINLVVKSVANTSYNFGNATQNRINGNFGMINVDSQNGEGTFDFCFVDSEDNPMTLDAFFFSFYDLDGPNLKGFESIQLESDQFTDYYVTVNTTIRQKEEDGIVTFAATEAGTGSDNPDDQHNMTAEQQDRGVVFQMEKTNCFTVKLFVKCERNKNCNGGRNFLFAGKASQIVPTCEPTPFPSVQPTKEPTAFPTKEPTAFPTKEPTAFPTKEPTAFPTKEPTAFPTKEPTASPTGDIYDPGVEGDPHFKTWAGEFYDFHGVCDLVLLKNTLFQNGLDLNIHIRTSRMLSWSFVSVVALRIGEDILEVTGGEEGDNFWINEVKGRNKEVVSKNGEMALVATLSGYPVYYTEVNSEHREFEIDLGGPEKIKIGTWHSFVRIQLKNAKSEHFGKSMGLMGSFSEGIMLARDNVTVLDDFNAFGQEWQVLYSEPKLFRVVEGPQHPTQCEIPSSLELRRHLADSTISLVNARKACADAQEDVFDLCLFDVLATNDKMTAGAY